MKNLDFRKCEEYMHVYVFSVPKTYQKEPKVTKGLRRNKTLLTLSLRNGYLPINYSEEYFPDLAPFESNRKKRASLAKFRQAENLSLLVNKVDF